MRIIAEGSAIVISILLAFAIESWSDQGDLQSREQEILRSLLVDFESSRERLLEIQRFHQATQGLTLELLQIAISDTFIADATLNQYLADLSWTDVTSPIATGALHSVISGGELNAIRNDELRKMLADWPVHIETINTNLQQGGAFFSEKWVPYLAEFGYLPAIISLDSIMPGNPELTINGEALNIPSPQSHQSLLSDKLFHNLLSIKNWVTLDYLSIYQTTLARLDQTIVLLRNEIRATK